MLSLKLYILSFQINIHTLKQKTNKRKSFFFFSSQTKRKKEQCGIMCKCMKKQRASKGAQFFNFFCKKENKGNFFFLSSTETIHLRHIHTYRQTYIDNREIEYNIET